MGKTVNKRDIAETVSEKTGLKKAEAAAVVGTVIEAIVSALKLGDKVQISGFGTFMIRERAARTVRNPRTGEPVEVAASKAVVFRPSKGLKEAVN